MSSEDDARSAAISRINARRGFGANVVSFLLIGALMVVIWAVDGRGYFWPVWVIVPWGIGLGFHAWAVFGQKPNTESDIQREMRRGGDA